MKRTETLSRCFGTYVMQQKCQVILGSLTSIEYVLCPLPFEEFSVQATDGCFWCSINYYLY